MHHIAALSTNWTPLHRENILLFIFVVDPECLRLRSRVIPNSELVFFDVMK